MDDGQHSGPPSFRGRYFGVAVLVAVQYAIGALHFGAGIALLVLGTPEIYSIYTVVFSVLVTIFAYGLWKSMRVGWVGTVAVSLFVILADSLALLDLPTIPGIPKFAGFGEITYSVAAVVYLLRRHVRTEYNI